MAAREADDCGWHDDEQVWLHASSSGHAASALRVLVLSASEPHPAACPPVEMVSRA